MKFAVILAGIALGLPAVAQADGRNENSAPFTLSGEVGVVSD